MHIYRGIFAAILLVELTGCATTPLPPAVIDSEKLSIIGISLKVRAPIKIFSNKPETVFFARIDEDKELFTKDNFIRSNYAKDGQVYLLNAKPGRYVAIGCFYKKTPAGQKSTDFATSYAQRPSNFTTFFSEDLITLTDVTVGSGKVVFMGKFVVDSSAGLKNADATQAHYAEIIAPYAEIGVTASIISSLLSIEQDYYFTGSVHLDERDKQAEMTFLTNAVKHFKGSDWVKIFQRQIDNR